MPKPRFSFFAAAVVALCLGLVVIVVVLVLRVRNLESEVWRLQAALDQAGEAVLVDGRPLPEARVLNEAGDSLELSSPTDVGTLLFVTAPGCDHCDTFRPVWDDVATMLDGSSVRVLELVVDSDSMPPKDGRAYPAVVPSSAQIPLVRSLVGIPASILVDPDGVVQSVLYGEQQHDLSRVVDDFLFTNRGK